MTSQALTIWLHKKDGKKFVKQYMHRTNGNIQE
jgi:hypothetical protein